MEARWRLIVTNETQNIDKVSYLHGHYLNAVYLALIANPDTVAYRGGVWGV